MAKVDSSQARVATRLSARTVGTSGGSGVASSPSRGTTTIQLGAPAPSLHRASPANRVATGRDDRRCRPGEFLARTPDRSRRVCVLSCDVHHAYIARPEYGDDVRTPVYQLTCSPLHNRVPRPMRLAFRGA